MEKPDYQNMKVWLSTLKNLRLIHAITGEQMVKIVDRLVKQELERLQKESQQEGNQKPKKPLRRSQPFNSKPSESYSDSHLTTITAPSSL